MKSSRCDRTPAWAALNEHFANQGSHFNLTSAFASEAQRFTQLSLQAPEVFADLSKNLLDATTQHLLVQLAEQCGVLERRNALLAGSPVNITEGRAALHTALRAPASSSARPEVEQALAAMLAYAENVRDTVVSGIRHVVNIGIGGSDLGPQMAVPALDAFAHPQLQLHFVSNVDGHDLAPVLRQLNPHETLFVIASKTFTTQETLANAHMAKAWFEAQGGTHIAKHFVATTAHPAAAAAFGISTTFGFWDWVGGRYSLWSTIGLPIALAIGAKNFRALLRGAHAMDEHFAHAPPTQNLPLQLGLLDVWYRNFHRFSSRSVAPYHQGLKRLPAYLQQLEMESNGKRVDLAGDALPYATSPVVWGEPGTNAQHAYFQMLHQGTDVIPVEFILVKQATHRLGGLNGELEGRLKQQHRMLLANGLAQSQALMCGRTTTQALAKTPALLPAGCSALTLAQHRTFPGNRPSTTLVLDQLTPRSLGALLALYEHRVFTSGAVWGINSFDQWGVELGKALCSELLPRLTSGDTSGLDGSTAGLLQRLGR
jgi:glucose-6-phosphate isomerase